ncbi:hypothetical protein [Cryptosporangium sp. NPDC051539]|uniref:hypothetical protein n=1 Tax=Cryptosporangium sp. NPDC051539 TaxID=3363962 RepID=UPI0037A7626A
MIDSNFVFLAFAFNVLGTSVYVRKALQGRVKPHLVTWTLWAIVPYIAFFAQISEGVHLPAFITLVAGLNPTCTLIVAVRSKSAHWKTSVFDVVCGVSAGLGVAMWCVFSDARYAIVFAILADALAAIPTFAKSFTNPESESSFQYACLAASALITLASLDVWSFASYGWAAYLAVLGIGLALTIRIRGRRRKALKPMSTGRLRRRFDDEVAVDRW